MKKQHAQHNEKACDHLLNNSDFNDWAVTTAFYSALHYVHYELFPLTSGDTEFNNFDSYYNWLRKNTSKKINKHNATIQLVRENLFSCYHDYKFLFDTCYNARYIEYKISKNVAASIRERLDRIKSGLSKP